MTTQRTQWGMHEGDDYLTVFSTNDNNQDSDIYTIQLPSDTDIANAEHIVKCVSLHDELLKACAAIVAWKDAGFSEQESTSIIEGAIMISQLDAAINLARAAIAKATQP